MGGKLSYRWGQEIKGKLVLHDGYSRRYNLVTNDHRQQTSRISGTCISCHQVDTTWRFINVSPCRTVVTRPP